MGVFLVGSLVWMVAILLDKNRVFPKWFGYLNLCNALTEVVVAPAWIFQRGVFAWNGAIAWWINMVVFVIYTGVFITLLRKMIQREDFGTGPLPDLPEQGCSRPAGFGRRRSDDERRRPVPARNVEREADAGSCPGSRTCGCSFSSSRCSSPATSPSTSSAATQNQDLYLQSQAAPRSARRGLQHDRPAD